MASAHFEGIVSKPVDCYSGVLKENSGNYYRQVLIHDQTYKVDDTAILQAEYDIEVVKLNCIYETADGTILLQVRKYVFARNLSDLLRRAGCRNFHINNEVVEDCRKDYTVDPEQILRPCVLMLADDDEDPALTIKEYNLDSNRVFICRYMHRSDGLWPILKYQGAILIENNNRNPHRTHLKGGKRKSGMENTPVVYSESEPALKSPRKMSNLEIGSPAQRILVKRNLNESFGLLTHDESLLNYSVVNNEDKDNPLVIKLKVSGKVKSPVVLLKNLNISPKVRQDRTGNIRKSARKKERKSYAEYLSPESTPVKIKSASVQVKSEGKRSTARCLETRSSSQIQEATREKRMIKTPKRYKDEIYATPTRLSSRRMFNTKFDSREENERRTLRTSTLKKELEPEKNNQRRTRSTQKCYIDSSSENENEKKKITSKHRDTESLTSTPRTRLTRKDADSDTEVIAKLLRNTYVGTPKSTAKQTSKTTDRAHQIRKGDITPSMHNRSSSIPADSTPLARARAQLHVSYVPKALPCREVEYRDIYNFIERKLLDKCGGCMYISGVPGTGKTATVTSAIKSLQQDKRVPKFSFLTVNGMMLTEPKQAYVEILKQLTGKSVPWQQALTMLEKRFTKTQSKASSQSLVLLIDELDILCNRRQDVVYNLLDWPSKSKSPLVVVAIANTMDLPERQLRGRVASRLGLARLPFAAYTHQQLRRIVAERLSGGFGSDAVEFVARKVASVSGDARRALDICRRAAEIAERDGGKCQVDMQHVNEALDAMMTQPKVRAIRSCSRLEQLVLQAIVAEIERTGVEETTFTEMFKMLESVAAIDGFRMVSGTVALSAIYRLSACRLLLADQKGGHIHQRLFLNVSIDDVYYALKED